MSSQITNTTAGKIYYTPYIPAGICPNCGRCEKCGRPNWPYFSPYWCAQNTTSTVTSNGSYIQSQNMEQ